MTALARFSVSLLCLVALPIHAEDWRDCTELYVYAVSARVSHAKPSGLPWDEGSSADPKLSVKPAARKDLPWTVVGEKSQDAPGDVYWNASQPSEAKGVWMPVRTGDALALSLVDTDMMADDLIVGGQVQVPKDLGTSGAAYLQAEADGSKVTLGVSGYDGKRTCSGVAGKPRWAKVAAGVEALVDVAQYNELFADMGCDKAPTAPVCGRPKHVASFADFNKDGIIDFTSRSTEVHSAPGGTPRLMYGAWLGKPDGTARKVFSGPCMEWQEGVLTDGILCREADQAGTVIHLARGTARPATAADFAKVEEASRAAGIAELRAMQGEDLRGAPEHETLCREDEVPETTCAIKGGKLASLCSKGAVLFYRFGTKAKVELEWPKAATPAKLNFKWEDLGADPEQAGTGEVARTLSFQNGDFTYAFWEHQYRMNDNRTLSVTRKGKRILEEECEGMSLEGIGRLFQ